MFCFAIRSHRYNMQSNRHINNRLKSISYMGESIVKNPVRKRFSSEVTCRYSAYENRWHLKIIDSIEWFKRLTTFSWKTSNSVPADCRYLFIFKKSQSDQLRFKDAYFGHSLWEHNVLLFCKPLPTCPQHFRNRFNVQVPHNFNFPQCYPS